jgi:hypothetical protein
MAVELNYATPRGRLTVTQGWPDSLREVLQRQPPRWTRSEERLYSAEHRPTIPIWVMHGDRPDRQWAALEYVSALLFLEHNGPEDEFEAILQQTPYLERISRGS